MENNPRTTAWAIRLVEGMDYLPGFPKSDAGLASFCEEFLSIVENEERGLWLISQMKRGSKRFPVPLTMRRIYNTKYDPADGIHPERDLMAVKHGLEE